VTAPYVDPDIHVRVITRGPYRLVVKYHRTSEYYQTTLEHQERDALGELHWVRKGFWFSPQDWLQNLVPEVLAMGLLLRGNYGEEEGQCSSSQASSSVS